MQPEKRSLRESFHSNKSLRRSQSQTPQQKASQGPISIPGEEYKQGPNVQLITSEEEDAYRAKASGMGQTRGMSIVSSEED